MTTGSSGRTLPWDWYSGIIPDNVLLDPTAYVETTYSFSLYRSEASVGVRMERGSAAYLGTMFDVGRCGQVSVGQYAMLNGARIICDGELKIGDYCLISWNVVLMDTYRLPFDRLDRRSELERVPFRSPRRLRSASAAQAIRIGQNVWIGFDACVLPGVHIGEGSIVGARSVVNQDVPAYTVVAGNPARPIRRLDTKRGNHEPREAK